MEKIKGLRASGARSRAVAGAVCKMQCRRTLSLLLSLIITSASLATAGYTPMHATDVESGAELAITEICFNSIYRKVTTESTESAEGSEEAADVLKETADVFEYIEVTNMSDRDIDLSDAAFYYMNAEEGTSAPDTINAEDGWLRNQIVPFAEGGKCILKAGAVGIYTIYAADTVKAKHKYETLEERQLYLDDFNDLYGCNISSENFFILPKNISGSDEVLNQDGYRGFNLVNTQENVHLKLCGADGAVYAHVEYNANMYNGSNTALQFIYNEADGTTSAAGITRITPGTHDRFQLIKASDREIASGTAVKFMSYNVCASGTQLDVNAEPYKMLTNRSGIVVQTVQEADPDVIAFQEINHEWLDIFQDNLGDVYARVGVSGKGNEDGENGATWDLYNCIYYKKSKYTALRSGNFFLSSTPSTPGSVSWGDGVTGDLTRVCTWIMLQDKATSVSFTVFNTHLDAKVDASRMKGICLVLEQVAEIGAGGAVFAMADYNFQERSEFFTPVEESGLLSARLAARETMLGGSTNAWLLSAGRVLSARLPIDQCFFDPNYADIASHTVIRKTYDNIGQTDGVFPSDHCPIIIDAIVLANSNPVLAQATPNGISHNNIWIISGCAAAAVAIVAVVIILARRKRSK